MKHCAFLGSWHPKAANVAARSRRCKQLGATDGHATRSRCHRWEPRIHSVSGVSTQGTCPNILGFKKMTRPMGARYRPISEPDLTREFWFFHHLEIDHYHVLLGTNIVTIFTQKSWTWHEHTWTSSPVPGRPPSSSQQQAPGSTCLGSAAGPQPAVGDIWRHGQAICLAFVAGIMI